MKKVFSLVLIVIALLAITACSQSASASEAKSDKPRQTPSVSQTDSASLAEGNNSFAFNMYQTLKNQDGNLFFSPYSISEALAMTFGGARGDTEKQMAATLRFILAQDRLHPAFNGLDQQLASRGQGAQGADGKGFRLNIANAIWGQQGFKFNSEYLDLLAQNYGAGMRLVDYINNTEQSRQTINNWVSDRTEGKILNLLPQGSLNTLTRLVLTNAIYFNAAWKLQFEKTATKDGQFTLNTGNKITVPMMHLAKSFKYAESNSYQALELPYDGNQLAMVILLPRAEQFKSFESGLNSPQMQSIIQSLKQSEVRLTMPRFKVESEISLKKSLSELGMPVAFTEQADFSGMNGKKDLFVSDVVHKAFVSVDEAGTEAAAATGVIVGTTSMPIQVYEVILDHPFIFLIRDIPTNTTLFIGRVMNPAP
jgi:serpin B